MTRVYSVRLGQGVGEGEEAGRQVEPSAGLAGQGGRRRAADAS